MSVHVDCDMRSLTPFQTKWVEDLKVSNDFNRFIGCTMTEAEAEAAELNPVSPVSLTYYTKDRRLHSVRLGRDRVIKHYTVYFSDEDGCQYTITNDGQPELVLIHGKPVRLTGETRETPYGRVNVLEYAHS